MAGATYVYFIFLVCRHDLLFSLTSWLLNITPGGTGIVSFVFGGLVRPSQELPFTYFLKVMRSFGRFALGFRGPCLRVGLVSPEIGVV